MARSRGGLPRVERGLGREKAGWVVIGVDTDLGIIVWCSSSQGWAAWQAPESMAAGPGSET